MSTRDDPGADESEQLRLTQRLVEESVKRTRLAEQRNEMSADRSRMSAERSVMSADRSRMSAERSLMSADRSRMSADRSRMSADRSEMSAERTYLNAERTLSVWIRTALAVMVVGIAIDRFGLFLQEQPIKHPANDTTSTWVGAAMVALGILMTALTGVRFLRYAATYRQTHSVPYHHGPFLAPLFAVLVTLFGVALLVLLLLSPN